MRDERIFIPTICIYYIAFTLGLHTSDISEKCFLLLSLILLLCIIVCYILYKVKARLLQVWSRIKRALISCMNYIRSHILVGIMIVSGLLIILYHSYYQDSNTICESISSLLLNVAGAFVALYLIYLFLKPKFEVDQTIAQGLDNRIWICVRNKSSVSKLYNLKLELSYYRFIDSEQDYDYLPIEVEEDNTITMLYSNWQNEKIKQKDSFYVFHSQNAFIRDNRYDGIRCRVSATNVISNVVEIKDEYVPYKDEKGVAKIKYGEFVGNKFISIEEIYSPEDSDRIKKIIDFSNTMSNILISTNNKQRIDAQNWEIAKRMLVKLKSEYKDFFSELPRVQSTIDGFDKKLKEFYELITAKDIMTPEDRDCQRTLLNEMNRYLIDIVNCMAAHLKITT